MAFVLPPSTLVHTPLSSLTMRGALNHLHFSPLTLDSGFGVVGHTHGDYLGSVGGASSDIASSGSVVSSALQLVVPALSDLSSLTLGPSPAMASPLTTI
jgi:hypothetical protein